MRALKRIAPGVFALVIVGASGAAAGGAGRAEFAAGDFQAARDGGRADGAAEGLAIACQAGLVIGSYLEPPDAAVLSLHGALNDCARAIEAGSGGPDAYVNYAIGLSFEAKRLRSRRLAANARRLMEDAARRFPQSGYARGALGGWHASVSEQGLLARSVLGASRDSARRAFAEALRLEPKNFAVNYQYVRFLAAGDERDRAEAATAAQRVTALSPEGRFEAMLAERARIIAAALASGDVKATAAALEESEPFNGVEKSKAAPPAEARFKDRFSDVAMRDAKE